MATEAKARIDVMDPVNILKFLVGLQVCGEFRFEDLDIEDIYEGEGRLSSLIFLRDSKVRSRPRLREKSAPLDQ